MEQRKHINGKNYLDILKLKLWTVSPGVRFLNLILFPHKIGDSFKEKIESQVHTALGLALSF